MEVYFDQVWSATLGNLCCLLGKCKTIPLSLAQGLHQQKRHCFINQKGFILWHFRTSQTQLVRKDATRHDAQFGKTNAATVATITIQYIISASLAPAKVSSSFVFPISAATNWRVALICAGWQLKMSSGLLTGSLLCNWQEHAVLSK